MPDGQLSTPDRAQLDRLLKEAGIQRPLDEVVDLLQGIAAAPPPPTDDWLRLVDAGLDVDRQPELSAELERMRAQIAGTVEHAIGGDQAAHAARLAALRAELGRRGLTGFVVPRSDEHQGEYVPANAERLLWLTGFSGSAGVAVVLADRAGIFVDGRYTLQVRKQVDMGAYDPQHLIETPPWDWVRGALKPGDRLGLDPWLHTGATIGRWQKACQAAGAELVLVDDNPLDAVWDDQPATPVSPIVPHPLQFAGRSSAEKRTEIAEQLAAAGQQAVVLTDPASIAWLLNVRGADVPNTPLPLSFAILRDDGSIALYTDERKASPDLVAHLGNAVALQPRAALAPALDDLAEAGAVVRADPQTAAGWVFERLKAKGGRIVAAADPCLLPKACKNKVELDGMRASHRRDGAAVTRFLHWIASEGAQGGIDELGAVDRLAAFRAEGAYIQQPSFDTIAGSGPNGAVIHYRSTPATNRPLDQGSLLLVDSGAQYLDGTTDITRTMAIGTPSDEMRDRFTRVLQGHIALAMARFPVGTTGSQLDTLARMPLWRAGLDYDHGTGHGVGSYLSVHEGPQRISKMPNAVALQPGMIISNEPGYYKEGAYGIRIENLVAVVENGDDAAERPMLAFETLTLAPIDLTCVVADMLSPAERDWLNTYHARVRQVVAPLVDDEVQQWLEQATRPI